MIGYISICIFIFLKRHFFCIHKFKRVVRRDNGNVYYDCEKCGFITDNHDVF